jgi:hypothetical protein
MASTTLDQTSDKRAKARLLHGFLDDCAGSALREEADRVRDAVSLLGGSGVATTGALDKAAIESMLVTGAAIAAVIEIVGRDAVFMLSRGVGNVCLASVVQPDSREEATAQGPTLALALLAAHVGAVLGRLESSGHVADSALMRVPARLH